MFVSKKTKKRNKMSLPNIRIRHMVSHDPPSGLRKLVMLLYGVWTGVSAEFDAALVEEKFDADLNAQNRVLDMANLKKL